MEKNIKDIINHINNYAATGVIHDALIPHYDQHGKWCGAPLAVLADVSVVHECVSVAEKLSNAEPYQIVKLVVEHHKMITQYLFIRSVILDDDPADDHDDFNDLDL